MITYEQILTAWEAYHASQSRADWDALWILVQGRTEVLIKVSLRGRRIDDDDLHDMIADATCSVMERLRAARYADLPWIRSHVYMLCLGSRRDYLRRQKASSVEVALDDTTVAVDILQKPCQQ